MARTDNLSNFLTDVAGAIKEKKGSETSIPASNFDTEIRNLPSQGTYESKSVNITSNGNTTVTPDTGYDALSQVTVNVAVPEKQLQTKSYTFTQNANLELEPDTGYDGFSKVGITINVEGGSSLPYTELEYIESTGTQYIDTGVTNARKFTGKIAETSHGSMRYLFGSQSGYEIIFRDDGNNYYIRQSQSSNVKEVSPSFPSNSIFEFNVDFINNEWQLDTQSGTFSDWEFTATTNYNFYLFARNQNGSASDFGRFKIYNFKMYNSSNNLIRDFIPVKRNSDNVICLYDKISKTYFTNQGTGTFIAGPEVVLPYTELEYIESTGTQYIDTGIIGDDNKEVEIKMNRLSATSAEAFFGSWSSSNCIMVEINQSKYALFWKDTGTCLDPGIGSLSSGDKTIYYTSTQMGIKDADGTIERYYDYTNTTWSTNLNMYLFARNQNGSANNPSKVRIYRCKIWDNGTLVRDLLPVIKNANNEICMYDLVTETFFTNAGSGAFIAGPSVEIRLQEKTATPTTSRQIITPDATYDGLSKVTISGVTSAIDNNIAAGNIKSGVTILGVTGTYEGSGGTDDLRVKAIPNMTIINDEIWYTFTNALLIYDENLDTLYLNTDFTHTGSTIESSYTMDLGFYNSDGSVNYLATALAFNMEVAPNTETHLILEMGNTWIGEIDAENWEYITLETFFNNVANFSSIKIEA